MAGEEHVETGQFQRLPDAVGWLRNHDLASGFLEGLAGCDHHPQSRRREKINGGKIKDDIAVSRLAGAPVTGAALARAMNACSNSAARARAPTISWRSTRPSRLTSNCLRNAAALRCQC